MYLRGSRISDTIEKKPGVPEKANTRFETAEIPSENDGLPTILKSECQGWSVCGAAAGRSSIPTAMVTIRTGRYEQCGSRVKGFGELTSYEDTWKSDPGKPGYFTESAHTAEDEPDNGGNGNEHSSACAVGRDCVQSDRDTQDSGAAHEDPICCELADFRARP